MELRLLQQVQLAFCVDRGPDEPRPADVRQRARHPGIRHDVCDENRTAAVVNIRAAATALQPDAGSQAEGPAIEDATIVAAASRVRPLRPSDTGW